MTAAVGEALALWNLQEATCAFVAGRENQVYRLASAQGDFALRLKRPGYRSEAELASELDWMAAMDRAGLQVPRPMPSRNGRLLERVGGGFVDIVSWLPGRPVGQSRAPLQLADGPKTFHAIGVEMARLHGACDSWTRPAGFRRCAWDVDGLLGDTPLWGRFWENPTLDADTSQLFLHFRQVARHRLTDGASRLDHGLIHADLVRENVLLDGETVQMIDFDDGGFGYRQFDLATVLLKNRAEPNYPALKAALLEGYLSQRALDLGSLDIFLAIRALTYVGWIVPRIHEDGGTLRNARFVDEARRLCTAFLQGAETS
jgi:Ser/Thr protein kinase RdoA (MazF antagonist)